jgi:hypothetical protein
MPPNLSIDAFTDYILGVQRPTSPTPLSSSPLMQHHSPSSLNQQMSTTEMWLRALIAASITSAAPFFSPDYDQIWQARTLAQAEQMKNQHQLLELTNRLNQLESNSAKVLEDKPQRTSWTSLGCEGESCPEQSPRVCRPLFFFGGGGKDNLISLLTIDKKSRRPALLTEIVGCGICVVIEVAMVGHFIEGSGKSISGQEFAIVAVIFFVSFYGVFVDVTSFVYSDRIQVPCW